EGVVLKVLQAGDDLLQIHHRVDVEIVVGHETYCAQVQPAMTAVWVNAGRTAGRVQPRGSNLAVGHPGLY
ncbi:MAG TPA: hypothetical protein PKH30_08395, partial [Actinomycetota bacterium]|nr:hypothetical protein [Actinomycetota bacterium]HUM87698.1 hypothetical protein [Actinomycetota bacterium]